jgi:hypothetical protein
MNLSDNRPETGNLFQQPFLHELANRFADRRPANAKFFGQTIFRENPTGRKMPGRDSLVEQFVCTLR